MQLQSTLYLIHFFIRDEIPYGNLAFLMPKRIKQYISNIWTYINHAPTDVLENGWKKSEDNMGDETIDFEKDASLSWINQDSKGTSSTSALIDACLY